MGQRWIASIAVLAAATLVVAMGMGLGSPLLLMGATVAAVGILAGVSARRSERPTEYVYRGGAGPKRWTWWSVPAAILAVLYILASIGQLIDDPKWTNLGAVGIMAGFASLIVFGLRLRDRSRPVGNWMIAFAAMPALMFFWVVWPTVLGLVIIVGSVAEAAGAVPRKPLPA